MTIPISDSKLNENNIHK